MRLAFKAAESQGWMLFLYVKDDYLFLISLCSLTIVFLFPTGLTLKEKDIWWFTSSSPNVEIHNHCTNADAFSTQIIDLSALSMWISMAYILLPTKYSHMQEI